MDLWYVRVSTRSQHADRQLYDENIQPNQLYIDNCSARDADRPELRNLLRAVREGDVVHVHSVDRLGRNMKDILTLVDKIISKGAEIRFHQEGLSFSNSQNKPLSWLVLHIVGAFVQWEYSQIRERQEEGYEAARISGKPVGRPSNITEEQKEKVRNAFRNDPLYCVSRISRETGVPRSTCHRIREELKKSA